MKSGVIYYANDSLGNFNIAIKYSPDEPLAFCKAAMSCGVFAIITPVGNVRVFTHRQVSRLLSGKPMIITISFVGDKLHISVWKEKLFDNQFTISETMAGITIGMSYHDSNINSESFYYITKAAENDNTFISFYSNVFSTNFSLKNGRIYLHGKTNGLVSVPKEIPAGKLIRINLDQSKESMIIEMLDTDLNANLSTVNSLVLVIMFLKVVGKSSTYGDMMTIPLATTMFSKNDVIRVGFSKLMENMGYTYAETSKSVAMLYPIGCEEDAAIVNRNDILSFQLEKKEMILSIVNWSEKESDN